MIHLAKRGKYYTLTVTDEGNLIVVEILSWKQIAELYCLISGIVCRKIKGK